MTKCTKGLHEMTEDNIYRDGRGRKHCRACIRRRKKRNRQGVQRQPAAHHKAVTFNKDRTAMDEALDAQPPVITWERDRGGVWRAIEVVDPHADNPGPPLRKQRQLEAYERKKAAEGLRPIDIAYLGEVS